MFLPRTSEDLRRLVAYLIRQHGYEPAYTRLQAQHAPAHDPENEHDPRVFCYVKPDRWKIFCSCAVESVSPRVRLGLLLHEIVHLRLDAFKGAGSEVDVDAYILDHLPMAGYTYADHLYRSPFTGDDVTAKAVEHVSQVFADAIQRIR